MNTRRIKKISLSLFIIISVFLILVHLYSSLSTTDESQHLHSPGTDYRQADSLLMHPDSLWDKSEFYKN